MSVRAFPRTGTSPQKRILLVPIILIFGGWALTILPGFGFLGIVLAMAGVLTIFLVGMVFADLWAAARRTKQIIKAREDRGVEEPVDIDDDYDPFQDTIGTISDD
ncbi:MAG: hypothetical protein RTU30_13225 [Candidatus Thorarchaeota archaeon]